MENGFGGEFGGQMQGGRGMGRPGDWSNGAAEDKGSAKETLYAGVSIVLQLYNEPRDHDGRSDKDHAQRHDDPRRISRQLVLGRD
ncbi:hypothetical protein [Paenibacillus sp. ISL-20]|uniref:hypothetical protein n=1 Tax=Paenibacillus sp. ISL-20 TaxID=2819163 RepID=UPI0020352025|nr:hypothetical protein [Paenibacillus sp. ISL-20]